jgi:hypothetical protein
VGQLARLASRHEPDAELARQRPAEDEASRLGGDDQVDPERTCMFRQQADRVIERPRIEQKRSDVLEDDPRLGEVRNVADAVAEVDPRDARRTAFDMLRRCPPPSRSRSS